MESRHNIGDIVLFQPNLNKIDAKTGQTTDLASAVKCLIVGIGFTQAKVLYDLAVEDDQSPDGFYTALPIKSVDSFMVCPMPLSKREPQASPVPTSPNKSDGNALKKALEELADRKRELPQAMPPLFPNYPLGPYYGPNAFPPGTIICGSPRFDHQIVGIAQGLQDILMNEVNHAGHKH